MSTRNLAATLAVLTACAHPLRAAGGGVLTSTGLVLVAASGLCYDDERGGPCEPDPRDTGARVTGWLLALGGLALIASSFDVSWGARAPAATALGGDALQRDRYASWTPPRVEGADDELVHLDRLARVSAAVGRCDDARVLATRIRLRDPRYYTIAVAPDPVIAGCH